MHSHLMIVIAASACALAACDRPVAKDESPPAGKPVTNTSATESVPAAEFHDAVSAADNASNVKRFADEEHLTATVSKLMTLPATVRTMPLGAQVVAVFDNPGEDRTLTQIARDHDYYLVVFSDLNQPSKRLAGWIYKDNIEGEAAKAETGLSPTCKTGEVYVSGDGLCATTCAHDGDCTTGAVCDGNTLVPNGAGSPSHAQYCIGGVDKK